MTLLTEVMELLDLVGSRDCIHADFSNYLKGDPCEDDACEPCRARVLNARLLASWERVVDQTAAMKAREQ